LSKLPKIQKVNLLAALMKTFGITATELTSLRGQVSRQLKGYENAPVAESKLNELDLDNSTSQEDSTSQGGLDSKGEKLEKTQAYQMLVKAIENKPATAQVAFVIDMLSKLPLDDTAKRMLKMKIRSELK
jgi:hypothetical protein